MNMHIANCFENILLLDTFLCSSRAKAENHSSSRCFRSEIKDKSVMMTELHLTGPLWF